MPEPNSPPTMPRSRSLEEFFAYAEETDLFDRIKRDMNTPEAIRRSEEIEQEVESRRSIILYQSVGYEVY